MFEQIGSALSNRVLDIVMPPLITAIAGLIVAVLTQWLRKLGVELKSEQKAELKTTVTEAIQAVEEEARSHQMTSSEKHATAAAIVMADTPKADPATVDLAIKATMPEVRASLAPAPVVNSRPKRVP